TRLYLLAPIVRGRKGEYRKELAELQKKGFQRAKLDGKFYDIGATPALDKKLKHDIEIVVDRIVVKPDIGNRLPDSIETALNLADGLLVVEFADEREKDGKQKQIVFSSKFACPVSGFTISEIEPRLFSFNNPHGACPECDGLGVQNYFDEAMVVPDESLTLRKGAVAPWAKSSSPYYLQTLEALARHYKFSMNEPWEDLPKKVQQVILHGSGDEVIKFTYDDGMRRYDTKKEFEGVIPNMDRRYGETDSAWIQEDLERFQSESPCEVCNGYRLKPEALSVKIGGLHVGQVCGQSIRDADSWFRDIDKKLNKQQKEIAARILKEIRARLKFLNNVGLDYLTLARSSGTLSGGESQRIRLASQIGSGLTGVLYVLDEPSIGLHQRDNAKLLESLKGLRDMGNTVIVVEHDEDAIRSADHVIDMGPGAGVHGGHIIAEGTPADIIASKKSLTGKYLSGAENIPIPAQRRKAVHNRWLKVVGARGNNLKNVTAEIPLGTLTCITGVSGGGKSTLTIETLYKAAARKLAQAREHPAPHDRIEGLEFIDKVIDIDQSPIGRTPRSNPATY
ncbi:MAG: excinuclease ABC subunit UvrA, partial [Rhizobiales bacterium]|nr:excinuclease ABC subunit UvrA [Hyphomicrobiales bacterium]